jgi:hypothetical protein
VSKTRARQKVRTGDDDLATRAGDRRQVGLLDVVPIAQVVTHDQRGVLVSRRRPAAAQRAARAPVLAQLRPGDAHPLTARGRAHLAHQRPLDAHRVIKARRDMARGIAIVDDIDAAAEPDRAVDHRQLAVQPAQPDAPELPHGHPRPESHQPHPGILHAGLQRRRKLA